jgi:endonuclease YncB( thermonuclease family)
MLALFAMAPLAAAQSRATVTRVVVGDTVEATLATGQAITVRIIGIDTPETKRPGTSVECGGPEASESLRELDRFGSSVPNEASGAPS